MTTAKRRIEKLETSLTSKQAVVLWLQEAHSFNTIEEYVQHLKTQPDSAAPINKLTSQVAEAVKQTLKGQPQEEIDRAVYQAHKDVLFLFYLHKTYTRVDESPSRNQYRSPRQRCTGFSS